MLLLCSAPHVVNAVVVYSKLLGSGMRHLYLRMCTNIVEEAAILTTTLSRCAIYMILSRNVKHCFVYYLFNIRLFSAYSGDASLLVQPGFTYFFYFGVVMAHSSMHPFIHPCIRSSLQPSIIIL